jgi:hypothetical protein
MRTDPGLDWEAPGDGGTRFIGPPWQWLVLTAAALVAALVGAVALWPYNGRAMAWHLLGYLLSGLVGTCAVALYRRGEIRRRGHPLYAPVPFWEWLAGVLRVGAIVIAAVHAWGLATAWST